MLVVVGTIPVRDFPLSWGPVAFEGETLDLNGQKVSCSQGTGAAVSTASVTLQYLERDPPYALVAGDIGDGKGSRLLFEHLIKTLHHLRPAVLVLHYWLPSLVLMKKLWEAVGKCSTTPKLIADAGCMYAAKAAGLASGFDLFTPDPTEMAFLADPEASHPAYIKRHWFDTDSSQVPELVARAYQRGGAARVLLVKGAVDYVFKDGEGLGVVSEPNLPAMEAIGGTGDTVTGLVSALVYVGIAVHKAAVIAAKVNRMAGEFAGATPATKVWEIIAQFPAVLKEHLCTWRAGA
jgi:NAD(P)H-hydrate repair Nnr-like enzyme with NAD(P)H-hydrate dehydratase domain